MRKISTLLLSSTLFLSATSAFAARGARLCGFADEQNRVCMNLPFDDNRNGTLEVTAVKSKTDPTPTGQPLLVPMIRTGIGMGLSYAGELKDAAGNATKYSITMVFTTRPSGWTGSVSVNEQIWPSGVASFAMFEVPPTSN